MLVHVLLWLDVSRTLLSRLPHARLFSHFAADKEEWYIHELEVMCGVEWSMHGDKFANFELIIIMMEIVAIRTNLECKASSSRWIARGCRSSSSSSSTAKYHNSNGEDRDTDMRVEV